LIDRAIDSIESKVTKRSRVLNVVWFSMKIAQRRRFVNNKDEDSLLAQICYSMAGYS
jgi:hypothetical protein